MCQLTIDCYLLVHIQTVAIRLVTGEPGTALRGRLFSTQRLTEGSCLNLIAARTIADKAGAFADFSVYQRILGASLLSLFGNID